MKIKADKSQWWRQTNHRKDERQALQSRDGKLNDSLKGLAGGRKIRGRVGDRQDRSGPETGILEQEREAGSSDCRWQTGSKEGDRVWPLRRDGGQSKHSTTDAWEQKREF